MKNNSTENDSENKLPWVEASDNPWHVRLLDLRPISQKMTSTSKDPLMANNAISYGGEDGTLFWGIQPLNQKTINTTLSFPTDHALAPGVLFVPDTMEHKWAIYFDGVNLIFIRSWFREVFVIAKTSQTNNLIQIESITGQFTEQERPEFTVAFLNFLILSHGLSLVVPAPLPKDLETSTWEAGLWAFSQYGNMAHVGIFDDRFLPNSAEKLRTHSLLHIAIAKADLEAINEQVKNGTNVNALAGDGLSGLQWALAVDGTEPMQQLLDLGADPNVRSTEGATPIMNAVQSNKIDHLQVLINAGGQINAQDDRGFTALHRAAEMGHVHILKLLLAYGADKTIAAENHTALSLAQNRENAEIIDLLI